MDSSSLVKRFSRETGTRWVFNLFRERPASTVYSARITFVEVSSALSRKAASGQIRSDSEQRASRRLRRAFDYRLTIVEISESLILEAAELARKHSLRGYDAIQLAAAVRIAKRRSSIGASGLTFISADNGLNKAALAEGLSVENPNDHN